MNNNQKILIGVIIILLLLLIGAYAISQNNNGAAAPTPTPTPTPTPNPSGSGDGQGTGTQATPTPAPVVTPTPAPTATPTQTPALTTDPEPGSNWPYYDYNWSGSTTHEHALVSFVSDRGLLEGYDGIRFRIENPGDWDLEDGNLSAYDDSTSLIGIEIVRDGDFSSSYVVPVSYEFTAFGETSADAISSDFEVVQPAYFAAGQSSTYLSVLFDDAYLENLENGGWITFTIGSSPDYKTDPGTNEFTLDINLS